MLYDRCLKCEKLGKSCNGPNFVDMSATDIVEWCKKRKAILKMTNETIADLSGIPQGTINRIFSGQTSDFRYETMRPIIKALVAGTWQEHKCPAENEAHEQSSESVELLKEQIKWQKAISASLLILFAVSLLIIIVALVADRLDSNVGFFWR